MIAGWGGYLINIDEIYMEPAFGAGPPVSATQREREGKRSAGETPVSSERVRLDYL